MTQKVIITVQDIGLYRPLAKEIPQDRILPYIIEAQQFDLKKLLGDALFLDFMLKFDQSGDPKYTVYQELLNGKVYSYGGIDIEHPGLIGYISYCTLVRFFNNNQINATKYGLVRKNVDQSTPLDPKEIAVAVAELRSNSLAFQTDILKFLTTNGTSYPLYNYQDGSALNQMGVKFFDLNSEKSSACNGRTLTSF